MTKTINGIHWEAIDLMETISVHNRIFSAVGYDDKGNKFSGSADVDMSDEIQEITDIEPVWFLAAGKFYFCVEDLFIPDNCLFKKFHYYKCDRDNALVDEKGNSMLITPELEKHFDKDARSITWAELKTFVDKIPEEKLNDTAFVQFSDETHARPLFEPHFTDDDIWVHKEDNEDAATLEELKYLHDEEFKIEDYRLSTPKGTPFLWAE